MHRLALTIIAGCETVCEFEPLTCPIVLGRSSNRASSSPAKLYRRLRDFDPARKGVDRIDIARFHETAISRNRVLIEPTSDGHALVTNESQNASIEVDGERLTPQGRIRVGTRAIVRLGSKTISIVPSDVVGLAEPSIVPGRLAEAAMGDPSKTRPWNADLVTRCFQEISTLLQSAKTADDFFRLASQAMVQLLALDSGRALLFDGESWTDALLVQFGPPSTRVLHYIETTKKTCYQFPKYDASLAGVCDIVAAPILNSKAELIGALYGDRRAGKNLRSNESIDEPAAEMVKALADSVAVGLDRLEKQRAALLFEQFFTADLAQQPRISQMTSRTLARDLRYTLEKQGYSAKSCHADRGTQWVTLKRTICGSVLTAG